MQLYDHTSQAALTVDNQANRKACTPGNGGGAYCIKETYCAASCTKHGCLTLIGSHG